MDDAPVVRRARRCSTRGASGSPTSTARARPTSSTSAATACALYFNQSGNALERRRARCAGFPPVDSRRVGRRSSTCSATARRAWSGRRRCPATRAAPMRYVDLMGGQKPHLLDRVAQQPRRRDARSTTRRRRASTSQDKRGGHAVDHAAAVPGARRRARRDATTASAATASSRATRYHHGYFDGVEREFRGFGMVEQWDTEEFGALRPRRTPTPTNVDAASHVPPVLTRTWFHTGAYLDGAARSSRQFDDASTTASRARRRRGERACCSTTRSCPPG